MHNQGTFKVFTMDLVCNLSQWAGCYQAIQNQAKTSKMMNPTGTGHKALANLIGINPQARAILTN